MERLITLQAGPFLLNVHWRRSGKFIGLPTLNLFKREKLTPGETLELNILPTLAAIDPPGLGAIQLKSEWSCEFGADGSSRVLFWCSKTQAHVLEVKYDQSFTCAKIRALRSYFRYQHLNFLLTSATRWMVLHRLALTNGFMLHGAGILRRHCGEIQKGDEVWIGTGPSGAGKSTLSAFFQGNSKYEILSDETMILRPCPGGWQAWGTPWPGMLSRGRNMGAPLAAIFFLEKTLEHGWREMEASRSFSRLWSEVYVPPASPLLAQRTLQAVEDLLAQCPPRILGFRKDKSVVDFVDPQKPSLVNLDNYKIRNQTPQACVKEIV